MNYHSKRVYICPLCKNPITANMSRTVRKVRGIFQPVHQACQGEEK